MAKYSKYEGRSKYKSYDSVYRKAVDSVKRGSIEEVAKYFQTGNKDLISYSGYTFLHIACQSNQLDMVRYLLEIGAPVDDLDKAGRSSLLFAVDLEKAEIVELLLEHGASLVLDKWDIIETANNQEIKDLLLNCKQSISNYPDDISTSGDCENITMPPENDTDTSVAIMGKEISEIDGY